MNKSTDAVNSDITFGRTSSIHEGLMKFVCAGETDTDKSGKQNQPDSTDTIDIKRKRNTKRKNKVFGHVGSFSNRKLQFIGVILDSCLIKIFVERLIGNNNDFTADFLA